jgi:hypothetical protein
MKKARIMLTAIIAVAAVSGALAFKASTKAKLTRTFYLLNSARTACTISINLKYVTTSTGGFVYPNLYYTPIVTTHCTVRVTTSL